MDTEDLEEFEPEMLELTEDPAAAEPPTLLRYTSNSAIGGSHE